MGVDDQLVRKTDMDSSNPLETLLDMFDSLGESLENLARETGIDRSPEHLKDEATYHYHVEIGVTMVLLVIIFVMVFICLAMRRRVNGDSDVEDMKNILVDTPVKVSKRKSVSKKASFQYVGFRKPTSRVVEIV